MVWYRSLKPCPSSREYSTIDWRRHGSGTYGGCVDAAVVAARELSVAARRVLTVPLIAVVSAVVVMVTSPPWRHAATVGADERRRRARLTGAVAGILVRPAVNK